MWRKKFGPQIAGPHALYDVGYTAKTSRWEKKDDLVRMPAIFINACRRDSRSCNHDGMARLATGDQLLQPHPWRRNRASTEITHPIIGRRQTTLCTTAYVYTDYGNAALRTFQADDVVGRSNTGWQQTENV